MKLHLLCAEQQVSRSNLTKYCACHAERLAYLVLITYESSFTMRGATGITIQPHQILRLPRRKTHLLNHHHVWNLIYNAGSNRCHHPTSPNTAPATQNDSHAWSSSHMKPHFQCAEQQVSRSNLTKYCACHEKWHCKISKKISKNRWNVISNAGPIRAWSEHDPSMIRACENANRNPPRNRGYFSTSPRAFSIVKYNVSRPILHSNLHQVLRLPRKVTLERHHKYCACHEKWRLNVTKYCACHEKWHLNVTKYCACHKKCTWTSPSTAPATKSNTWTSPSTAPATKSDTWTSPNIAPTTKSNTWTSPSTAPATKSDTWSSPSTAPVTQKDSHT